jgi:hypothetical protein
MSVRTMPAIWYRPNPGWRKIADSTKVTYYLGVGRGRRDRDREPSQAQELEDRRGPDHDTHAQDTE